MCCMEIPSPDAEVRARAESGERVLITTLTKRMAEDLCEYYQQNGLRVRYLHSDIHTLERMEIIRDLRLGRFDVLVGINLLRGCTSLLGCHQVKGVDFTFTLSNACKVLL